jgi:cytidylate kinase
LETKLAAFNAQSIPGIFKILVVCEDEKGEDRAEIRIDRLINREKIPIEKAKEEVITREHNDLEKWRRMYVNNDQNWTYWDKKYYDLVINTYSHGQDESLKIALDKLGLKSS